MFTEKSFEVVFCGKMYPNNLLFTKDIYKKSFYSVFKSKWQCNEWDNIQTTGHYYKANPFRMIQESTLLYQCLDHQGFILLQTDRQGSSY